MNKRQKKKILNKQREKCSIHLEVCVLLWDDLDVVVDFIKNKFKRMAYNRGYFFYWESFRYQTYEKHGFVFDIIGEYVGKMRARKSLDSDIRMCKF